MASGLGDEIRKRIRAPKLMAGVDDPNGRTGTPSGPPFPVVATPRTGYSESDRQDMPFIYGPEGAKVFDLTNDLDVPGVTGHIQSIVSELERRLPRAADGHLGHRRPVRPGPPRCAAADRDQGPGAAGRVRHGPRPGPAVPLAIGAVRGYPGYEGLGAEPDDGGPLDHEVAHRPVFQPDPLDDIEEGTAFWAMVGAAVTAGMPLELVLEREGWDPADVNKVVKAKEEAAAKAAELQQRNTTTAVMPGKAPAGEPTNLE